MSSLANALFLRLNIWKMAPLGVDRWTHALKVEAGLGVGATSMFGSLGMCRYACNRFMGSSILIKSIQCHYLAS